MQRPPKSLSFSLSASSSHIVTLTLTPMEENVEAEVSSDPLFSCFITLYTLILIYSPNDSFRILLSPVLLISGALLVSLLRLGSTQPEKVKEHIKSVNLEETEDSNVQPVLVDESSSWLSEAKQETDSDKKLELVEWDLRAPLEVIHEAYEEDDGDDDDEEDRTRVREIERYPSLSLCYPESDSGSDSDSSSEFCFPEMERWITPEKMGYMWEEEDDSGGRGGEGLIEIKLGDDDEYKKMSKWNQTELDFHAEEDGLIEIDLFP